MRSGNPSGSFAFEVADVFTITGRGTVAAGHVTRGSIAVGDEIMFRSPKGELVKRRVSGIEAFKKIVQVANEGDHVGILLIGKPVPSDVLVPGVVFERA
jgi:elongation factor Tu